MLGAALARTPPADVEARAPGAAGARCAAALAALGDETRTARAAAIAALTALVRAPVPAGIERVHPDWLRERFERESSAVVRAVAAGLPDDVRRRRRRGAARARRRRAPARAATPGAPGVAALQRVVFAGLVPLAGAGAPATPIARELAALDAGRARARDRGARRRDARPLAAGCARRRWSRGRRRRWARRSRPVVLEGGGPRRRRRGGRATGRAAMVAAAGVPATGEAAFAIGAARDRGAAGRRRAPRRSLAVAQRLPPALGRRLLARGGRETGRGGAWDGSSGGAGRVVPAATLDARDEAAALLAAARAEADAIRARRPAAARDEAVRAGPRAGTRRGGGGDGGAARRRARAGGARCARRRRRRRSRSRSRWPSRSSGARSRWRPR